MAKYQAYPEYKDSGIEWLGKVPEHWEVKRLKYICKVQTGSKDTVNAIDSGCYPFFVRSQTVEKINTIGADCEAVLTAGDGVGVGKVYHYYKGKFDFHQRVYMLNNFSNVLGKFIYYYLSSNFYKVALEGFAKSTVDSLRLPQFLNFEFSFPDKYAQQKIINFLDHETAQIDTLIEKQQQLIKLLKEKRQAVISHAVTKGLNPDAPMRDSGVEWLGEIPAHWTCCTIKYQLDNLDSRRIPLSSEERGSRSGSYRYYGASGIIDYIDDYIFDEPTVLVGEDGANLVNRNTPLAFSAWDKYWVNNHAHILKANDNLVEYWAEVIEHIDITPIVSGSAQPKLTAEALSNLKISFSRLLDERKEIDEYIKKIKSEFDILIITSSRAIELLKERRTALISAAVTGKIDVRNWQFPKEV